MKLIRTKNSKSALIPEQSLRQRRRRGLVPSGRLEWALWVVFACATFGVCLYAVTLMKNAFATLTSSQ